MGSIGVLAEAEDTKAAVAETEEEEVGEWNEMDALLDFDMPCATVALQTQGFSAGRTRWKEAVAEEAREEGMKFDGVQRMWEGDVMDCFDDRRIAIESVCFPCCRFGKNMQRANLGSFFLQVKHSIPTCHSRGERQVVFVRGMRLYHRSVRLQMKELQDWYCAESL